jgi:gamma-glutamylputrescine oxidase
MQVAARVARGARGAARIVARALHTGADFLAGPPNPGAHIESYYSRTTPVRDAYPALEEDADVDVVVIGGGFAGVNTALSLAQHGKRVAVLESNRVAWAASGRNGGFAHPGYSLNMFELERLVGTSHTRALWDLTFDSLDMIRSRVRRWTAGAPPRAGSEHLASSVHDGMLVASWFDDAAGTASEVEEGNRILGREYFSMWPRERVRATYATNKCVARSIPETPIRHATLLHLPVRRARRYYDAIMDPASFHFHSLNYAQCVAAEAT